MMFTEVFSFRKVRFFLIAYSVLFKLPLIISPKRIYCDSECMVHQSPIRLYIQYLKYSQGDPSRPRIVPRPGRIQARALSQRRWERPRRPDALVSFWSRQEDLSWASLCRCHDLHRYRIGDLRIQRDESKGREWPRNPRQGRDIWPKRTCHVSRQHFFAAHCRGFLTPQADHNLKTS
jgi:hypothetical protein